MNAIKNLQDELTKLKEPITVTANDNNSSSDEDANSYENQEPPSKKPRCMELAKPHNESIANPALPENELNKYLGEVTTEEPDIFVWWQTNCTTFPKLHKLARKYLSVPATSCPSERLFSKAGEIISKKRSRLKLKNANNLIFLNQNQSNFL